jgi:hypothetical protein
LEGRNQNQSCGAMVSIIWILTDLMSEIDIRYVRTPILPQPVQDFLDGKGVNFALVDDAARAMLLLASDRTINGE